MIERLTDELANDFSRFIARCESEGVEYTCTHYSDWTEEFKEDDYELWSAIQDVASAVNRVDQINARREVLLDEAGYEL